MPKHLVVVGAHARQRTLTTQRLSPNGSFALPFWIARTASTLRLCPAACRRWLVQAAFSLTLSSGVLDPPSSRSPPEQSHVCQAPMRGLRCNLQDPAASARPELLRFGSLSARAQKALATGTSSQESRLPQKPDSGSRGLACPQPRLLARVPPPQPRVHATKPSASTCPRSGARRSPSTKACQSSPSSRSEPGLPGAGSMRPYSPLTSSFGPAAKNRAPVDWLLNPLPKDMPQSPEIEMRLPSLPRN